MKFATKDGHRPTVLVVEDEFIIALDLSETVRDLGFKVEGPFADNQNAFVAIDEELPDCAILDVKIADGEVYPLAEQYLAWSQNEDEETRGDEPDVPSFVKNAVRPSSPSAIRKRRRAPSRARPTA